MGKNLFLCILLIFFSILCWAQDRKKDKQAQPSIRSNHSISLSLLGPEYSYEQRLTELFSLIGRAGYLAYDVSLRNNFQTFRANYTMDYALALEPRFYTNIGRRALLQKDTFNNAADFVALRIQHFVQVGCFTLTPMYGIRRSLGKYFAHEFYAGARYAFNNHGITPVMNYRLLFTF